MLIKIPSTENGISIGRVSRHKGRSAKNAIVQEERICIEPLWCGTERYTFLNDNNMLPYTGTVCNYLLYILGGTMGPFSLKTQFWLIWHFGPYGVTLHLF